MQYDNPAARLLSILQEGKKIDPATMCRDAWNKILGTQSPPQMLSRLGKVMELPQLTIQQLQEHFPHHVQTWTYWSQQVNSAFIQQNIGGNWNSFITLIDVHTINYLQMSSDLLQSKATTKLILGDEIAPIREKLDSILRDLPNAEIPDEIKKMLLRQIQLLIASIDEYRITGALPILDEVFATIGHTSLHKEGKSFLYDHELGQRVLDVLNAISAVVTIATGVPQLQQAVQFFLPA